MTLANENLRSERLAGEGGLRFTAFEERVVVRGHFSGVKSAASRKRHAEHEPNLITRQRQNLVAPRSRGLSLRPKLSSTSTGRFGRVSVRDVPWCGSVNTTLEAEIPQVARHQFTISRDSINRNRNLQLQDAPPAHNLMTIKTLSVGSTSHSMLFFRQDRSRLKRLLPPRTFNHDMKWARRRPPPWPPILCARLRVILAVTDPGRKRAVARALARRISSSTSSDAPDGRATAPAMRIVDMGLIRNNLRCMRLYDQPKCFCAILAAAQRVEPTGESVYHVRRSRQSVSVWASRTERID